MGSETNVNIKMSFEGFAGSLAAALELPNDYAKAVARVKKKLLRKPAEMLRVRKCGAYYRLYVSCNGASTYIRPADHRVYQLARFQYLEILADLLEMRQTHDFADASCQKLFLKLKRLIERYDLAGLEIARIVLTQKQYAWYSSPRKVKGIEPDRLQHKTNGGVIVRTKSERFLGNCFETLAVPFVYEARFTFNASKLVNNLQQSLIKEGFLKESPVCFPQRGYGSRWNVPDKFSWITLPGSIWRAFDPVRGLINIYPDFTIMLNDGTLLIWEHCGMADEFSYRQNASERVFVLLVAGAVKRENLAISFEEDLVDDQTMTRLIARYILTRLWF